MVAVLYQIVLIGPNKILISEERTGIFLKCIFILSLLHASFVLTLIYCRHKFII